MKDHALLDQLTQQVLNKEITLEVACFRYLTRERDISGKTVFEYNPSAYNSDGGQTQLDARALLVTTFEVIQP